MRHEYDVKKQRAHSDAVLAERHRGFDLAAKDNTMKYERPSFSVVGEGTKESQDKYRENYDKIDWGK